MSTHQLDASGARALTTTINDPQRTTATVGAKSGDDVVVTLGNFNYVDVPIPATEGAVELIVRKRTVKRIKRDDQGNEVRDENRNVVYEDKVEEQRLLRFKAYFSASGHTAKDTEYQPNTPHTSYRVVNLENEAHKPAWVEGEIVSTEVIDLA